MHPLPRSADEGLLAWAERWAPEEASAWAAWRDGLTPQQRADALLPLQAALTGQKAPAEALQEAQVQAARLLKPYKQ